MSNATPEVKPLSISEALESIEVALHQMGNNKRKVILVLLDGGTLSRSRIVRGHEGFTRGELDKALTALVTQQWVVQVGARYAISDVVLKAATAQQESIEQMCLREASAS